MNEKNAGRRKRHFVATLLTIVVASGGLVLPACKGFIVNPTLSSIALTPETPSVTVGSTEQMTATGTYSDGSTKT